MACWSSNLAVKVNCVVRRRAAWHNDRANYSEYSYRVKILSQFFVFSKRIILGRINLSEIASIVCRDQFMYILHVFSGG